MSKNRKQIPVLFCGLLGGALAAGALLHYVISEESKAACFVETASEAFRKGKISDLQVVVESCDRAICALERLPFNTDTGSRTGLKACTLKEAARRKSFIVALKDAVRAKNKRLVKQLLVGEIDARLIARRSSSRYLDKLQLPGSKAWLRRVDGPTIDRDMRDVIELLELYFSGGLDELEENLLSN